MDIVTYNGPLATPGSRNLIAFNAYLTVIVSVLFVTLTDAVTSGSIRWAWYCLYVLSIPFILNRLRQGLVFDPLFLLGSAYLTFITAGTIFFEQLRGKAYSSVSENLVGVGYLFLLLGLSLGQRHNFTIFGRKARKPRELRPARNKQLLFVLMIIATAALVLLFVEGGGAPMLADNPNEARFDFVSGKGYLAMFTYTVQMIAFAVLFHALLKDNRRIIRRSHVFAAFVFLLLLSMGSRSIPLIFFGAYVGIYCYVRKVRIRLPLILAGLVAITIFVGVVGAYREESFAPNASAETELVHVLIARPKNFDLIVQKWQPSMYEYGMRYLENFKKFLPGSQTGTGVELKQMLMPNQSNMSSMAGISVSIIGEAYINFGRVGVPLIMFLVGYGVARLYRRMLDHPSFFEAALYFTLIFNTIGAFLSGVANKIFQFSIAFFWLSVVAYLYQGKRIRLGGTIHEPDNIQKGS